MQHVISNKEERMLIKEVQTHKEPKLIRAMVTNTITYYKWDKLIQVPENTLIIVDTANGIALLNGDQTDILAHEYREVLYS